MSATERATSASTTIHPSHPNLHDPKERDTMTRPITLFTGQWADLPFEEVVPPRASLGLRRARDRLLG